MARAVCGVAVWQREPLFPLPPPRSAAGMRASGCVAARAEARAAPSAAAASVPPAAKAQPLPARLATEGHPTTALAVRDVVAVGGGAAAAALGVAARPGGKLGGCCGGAG